MANIEQIKEIVLESIGMLSNPSQFNLLLSTLLFEINQLSPERMSFEESLSRSLDRVDPALDKRVGSVIFDTISPSMAEIANQDIVIKINREQSRLLDAVGNALDLQWGADNSLPRRQATRAIRIAKTFRQRAMNENDWDNDDERLLSDFPTGIRFFEPDTIQPQRWDLISTVGGIALLRAVDPGAVGHSYFGRVLPTSGVNNLARCEIIGTEIPGQDRELDDRYRQRLINHLARPMFGGNIWQYRKWFEETDGVGNTIIYPAWLGGSTSKVVVIDSQNNPVTDEFLDVLREIFDPYMLPLNPLNTRYNNGIHEYTLDGITWNITPHGLGNGHPEKGLPIGHELTLITPEEETVTIEVRVVLRPNISIGQFENIANDRIAEYVNEVRADYIAEWEDAILRGDAITLDDTIADNNTNYVIGVYHNIGLFMAKISAHLIDTRLISNVTGVIINGVARDYIMEQNKNRHIIPKFDGLNIIIDDGILPPLPISMHHANLMADGTVQQGYFEVR